jgi:hypothetical protein
VSSASPPFFTEEEDSLSSLLQYFYHQRVTEAELNLGFLLLEQADHNLASDIGVLGVVSGALPTEHTPVADLTVDLTAPARAYDALGRRVAFGTGQRVDCAVDATGIPTEISTAGQERWLGVFLKFDRLLSDPRTDGNSQLVSFRHDESFQLLVRQGPQGPTGAAPKVPLEDDAILLCDVRRRAGQTQIRNTDLDLSRRQAFVFVKAGAVTVATAEWAMLDPSPSTVQATLDEVDGVLSKHVAGTNYRHDAAAIDLPAHGFVAATNVQAAVHELVDKLSSTATGTPGAQKVGADAVPGTPNGLAASNVDTQLSQLLGFLNTHVAASTGAHAASAIAVVDATNILNGANVESALAEVTAAHGQDHFRGSEANAGQHKTIRQPALAELTGKALLWDAVGTGGMVGHLRVYADSESVWFVMNAVWNGTSWARDLPQNLAGGFRFSRQDFELFNDQTALATWTVWERRWRFAMGEVFTTSFEAAGAAREQGRIGIEGTNTAATSKQMSLAASTTFRSRFAQAPSSITLGAITLSPGFSGTPTVIAVTRDGFAIRSFQPIAADSTAFWYGTYTTVV